MYGLIPWSSGCSLGVVFGGTTAFQCWSNHWIGGRGHCLAATRYVVGSWPDIHFISPANVQRSQISSNLWGCGNSWSWCLRAHTFLLNVRWFGNFAYDNWIQLVCTSHVAAQHDTESILGIPWLGTMNCLITKGICSLPWLSVEQRSLITVINIISLASYLSNVGPRTLKLWRVQSLDSHGIHLPSSWTWWF